MEWLIGQWSMVEKEKILYESWSKINDTIIAGASVMTMHGDTIYTEKLSIRLISGELFYVPMVSNQNNGKPIMFHLVSNEEGVFVFENKLHDFPQRIVYAHPKEDSLYAYIEGMDKGKMDKIEFPMVRVK